jgi:hypothetical protein
MSNGRDRRQPIYRHRSCLTRASPRTLWEVPLTKLTDFEKPVAANQKILDQGISDGTLIAYGDDANLVHSADGYTHDSW